MKKFFGLFLILALISAPSVFAKDDEGTAVTKEAFNDVKVASEILNQANSLMTDGQITRQKGEVAMSLYARAGQLFERAEGVFKAVGSTYASQNDVDGARIAKETCLNSMNQLKQRIASLPA